MGYNTIHLVLDEIAAGEEQMIDLHAHILPGLDDGSKDITESLAMARVAREDGIHTIVATPHVLPGVFDNDKNKILSAVQELNQKLQEQNIAVDILPGAEYHLEADLPLKLAQGKLLTINDNRRYLLVELPSAFIPEYTAQVLYEIQLLGVTPIIAHPERNAGFTRRPDILQEMISRGVLAQVTSASITGLFGKKIKRTAFSFLRRGLVHLVSSDAHSSKGRAPLLSQAQKEIEKYLGSAIAQFLVIQNPCFIYEGESIDTPVASNNSRWKLFR
jgi:protein-tyrosine phosphatase